MCWFMVQALRRTKSIVKQIALGLNSMTKISRFECYTASNPMADLSNIFEVCKWLSFMRLQMVGPWRGSIIKTL